MAPCVGLIAEVGDKQDSENGTCNSPSSYMKYRQGLSSGYRDGVELAELEPRELRNKC
jgi:hypothetical protein